MKQHKFGKSSLAALKGVHPMLVAVVALALKKSPLDFKVLEGIRTKERQAELYAQGRTKSGNIVTWTMNSRHFIDNVTGYGHAVDILPEPYDWKDLSHFNAVAMAMFQAAEELGVTIRWGADWDMDGNFREKGETDSPHFELVL